MLSPAKERKRNHETASLRERHDKIHARSCLFFQDVAFIAGLYEAVVDMQFVEDDGRDIRIGDDVVGIEQCEAVVSGKEDAVAR